jgi:hypothetical protein
VKAGSTARRLARFVIHNWPLKLAAIALATLLYAGLVASQDSNTYPGPIQVIAVNQPTGTVVTNQLKPLEQVRYLAPVEVGRLSAEDFRATVDLASVDPTGQPVSVRVDVVPTDPRVTILEVQPRTIKVVLDEKISVTVPVRVARGAVPAGVDAGETVFSPESVTVTGPSAAVKQVVAARVNVALDPSGIDFDRDVDVEPIDAAGEVVQEVDVEPRTVHVIVPLFTNKESRTLPVNPVVTGVPAPGFRISGIEATPLVVSVEGDAEQLTQLTQADTAPRAAAGGGAARCDDRHGGGPRGAGDRDPDLHGRPPARWSRTRAALRPVLQDGPPDAVRVIGGPRPPGGRAARGGPQRRRPRAGRARGARGPVAPHRGHRRGDRPGDRHRHDQRTADAGAVCLVTVRPVVPRGAIGLAIRRPLTRPRPSAHPRGAP